MRFKSAAVGVSTTRPFALVRSLISLMRSRGIGGAGNSICKSYMSYRCSSRISKVSPKPVVVTKPARPTLPSINALVMSVVACTIGAVISLGVTPAFAKSWRTPVRTPSSGAEGVVKVLSTTTRPDARSMRTTSVNVPPISTANRQSATVIFFLQYLRCCCYKNFFRCRFAGAKKHQESRFHSVRHRQ